MATFTNGGRRSSGTLLGAMLIGALCLIVLTALLGLGVMTPTHPSCETTTNHAPIPCGQSGR
jgi:hypothetical protein